MAKFPVIQSPCPIKKELASFMEGDVCRQCNKQVHDISDWSDTERVALIENARTDLCVSYRLPVKRALAAAALTAAAAAMPMAAAAQDASAEAAYDDEFAAGGIPIIVGGIKDTSKVSFFEDKADKTLKNLPIEYEEETASVDHGATPAAS